MRSNGRTVTALSPLPAGACAPVKLKYRRPALGLGEGPWLSSARLLPFVLRVPRVLARCDPLVLLLCVFTPFVLEVGVARRAQGRWATPLPTQCPRKSMI